MTKLLVLTLFVGYLLGTCYGKGPWLETLSKATKGGVSSRISGGFIAYPGEFPFMVRVADGCGAVLISPTCALTAAHCVRDMEYSTIIAGDWKSDEWEETEQVRDACATVYPGYNPETLENDIAFLRTNYAFETVNNSFVRPIELPGPGSVPSDSFTAIVMGWGGPTEGIIGRQERYILKKATATTWSDQDCREFYGEDVIKDSMLCAGNDDDLEIFNEDSGGPLIMNSDVGSPTLIGLISWGSIAGGASRYPGVYTEVSYFMPWIQDLMSQNVSVCHK